MITNQDYPIQWRWVYKEMAANLIRFSLILAMTYLFFWFEPSSTDITVQEQQNLISFWQQYAPVIILLLAIVAMGIPVLRKITFSYSLEDDYLTVRQGIITRQERHLPYNVIQDLIVRRDLDDLVFNLAELTVENASVGGFVPSNRSSQNMLGSSNNHVYLVGLDPKDVTTLRAALLVKMLTHTDQTNSGL